MNASILLLGTTLALGGDPIVVGGTGCSGCGATATHYAPTTISYAMPSCGPHLGLFARLRGRLGGLFHRDSCASPCSAPVAACSPVCAPAPKTCGAPLISRPVFTGFTTSCSDPCQRFGLLDRLRSRFAGLRSCDAHVAPHCSAAVGCSTGCADAAPAGCTATLGTVMPAPVTPMPTPVTPPDKMPAPPKKDEPKKDDTKKDVSLPLSVPALPAVETPRVPVLGGANGKY